MKTISEKNILHEQIAFLRQQQKAELDFLKKQYKETVIHFQPLQLLKSTTKEILTTPHLKATIFSGILAIGTQYFTRQLLPKTVPVSLQNTIENVLRFTWKKIVGKRSKKFE